MILGHSSLIQGAALSLEDGEPVTDLAGLQDTRLSRLTRIRFADPAPYQAEVTIVADWSASGRTLAGPFIAGLLNSDLPIGTLCRLRFGFGSGPVTSPIEARIRQTATGRSALFAGDVVPPPLRFAGVSQVMGDTIVTSGTVDQTDWGLDVVIASSADGFAPADIASTSQRWIIVGQHGRVLVSDDGQDWVEKSTPVSAHLYRVTVVPDTDEIIAVGSGGTVLSSVDHGDTWTVQSTPTGVFLRAVAVGLLWIVAVGDNGVVIKRARAGGAWSSVPSGTSIGLHCCAEDGAGNWVIAGFNGLVRSATSVTLVEFQAETSGTTNHFLDLIRAPRPGAPHELIGVGEGGMIRRRASGGTWSAISNDAVGDILTIARHGDVLVCASILEELYRSDDCGATWSPVSVFTTTYLVCALHPHWVGSAASAWRTCHVDIVNDDGSGVLPLHAAQEITLGELELMPMYTAPYGIETGWRDVPVDNTTTAASVEEQPYVAEGLPTLEYELTLALALESEVYGEATGGVNWRDLRSAIQRGRRVMASPRGWDPVSQTVDPDLLHRHCVYGYARVVGGFLRTEHHYRWSLTVRGVPGDSET
jgi:photosystem II stability/assembly factor-like uncharacterized protein